MKRSLAFALIVSLTSAAPMAFAGGGGGFAGATEVTQLANNAELVAQVANSAQQVAQELQMYQNMVQNTLAVPNHLWSNVATDLNALKSIVQQGQAISFALSNVDAAFQQRYPGYRSPQNYQQAYRSWSEGSLDSIRGAMNAAGLQANNFATEAGFLDQLQMLAGSASGRLQALQVGNMIAVEQAKQMQRLRALQMAQMQAQSNYMAAQQQTEATDRSTRSSFFGAPGSQQTYQFQYQVR